MLAFFLNWICRSQLCYKTLVSDRTESPSLWIFSLTFHTICNTSETIVWNIFSSPLKPMTYFVWKCLQGINLKEKKDVIALKTKTSNTKFQIAEFQISFLSYFHSKAYQKEFHATHLHLHRNAWQILIILWN